MIQSIGIAKLGGSGGGGSAAANTMLSSELIASKISVGDNTIAHLITGTILNIEIKDVNNRKPDFSDFRWDGTNIYVYTPIELEDITFVISYTA